MSQQELKAYVQQAKHEDGSFGQVLLPNGWTVVVESCIVNGTGPHRAWKHLFYLVMPNGQRWGGYDTQASFLSWAIQFMKSKR